MDRKLSLVRETYGMLNAEAQAARAEALELAIVVLIVAEIVLALMKHYLGATLAKTKRLCYAGGVALNVKCNQRIIQALGSGHELFVQPGISDVPELRGKTLIVREPVVRQSLMKAAP